MVFQLSPWGGIYRGELDLHRLGEVSLAVGGGRPAKPRGQPAKWSILHWLSPPARASPPRIDAWQPRRWPNRLKPWPTDQGVGPADRPLGPLGLGSAHLVRVSNTPRGDDDFDIWSTSLCHRLKCSNLIPKFLKSNKHKKIVELS
jgi:hypothetical protein